MQIVGFLTHRLITQFIISVFLEMSHVMGKSTFCIRKNKGAGQLRSNCEADQRLVFATQIIHFLYFLNPKFPASCHLLCLYSLVCVGPVRRPHFIGFLMMWLKCLVCFRYSRKSLPRVKISRTFFMKSCPHFSGNLCQLKKWKFVMNLFKQALEV